MFAAISRAASFMWLLFGVPSAMLLLSDRAALGITSSATLFHLLGGMANNGPLGRLTRPFGFMHFPIFAGFTSMAAIFAPNFLMNPFAMLLDILGPILMIVQAVQAVRLSIFLSNYTMEYIYIAPGLIRSLILGVSVLLLGWTGYIYYGLYTHPSLDILRASLITCVATASFCVLFASLFSPTAVPSDPAVAALVAALAMRQLLPSRSAGLVSKAFEMFMPANWFTMALTVITLPLSLTPDAFARATQQPTSKLTSGALQACIVCMYARFVLSSVGRWDDASVAWHVVEAFVALAFYTTNIVTPLLTGE